ncbi:MAG: hypothetical protein K0R82_815, partial [Flavipsychrobacter sp.]|nr:hypothetical protein [Flavipsychrobacter sp.]
YGQITQSSQTNKEVHEMSNGVAYFIDDKGKWDYCVVKKGREESRPWVALFYHLR